ncbi:MAG: hypothetical protein DRQ02_12435, partial [Candidatus Latescibacterota bacterium]
MSVEDKFMVYLQEVTRKAEIPFERITIPRLVFSDIDIFDTNTVPQRFGVFDFGDVLEISNRFVDLGLLDAVLAREVFVKIIPKCIRPIPIANDLGIEFGRMKLKNDSKWLEIWKKVSPPTYYPGDILYDPAKQMPTLSVVSEKEFLWELIRVFQIVDRYGLVLTNDDYVTIFNEFRLSYTPKLSAGDLRVINLLLQGILDRKEISKRIGMSIPHLSTIIKRLKEKEVIYYEDMVNFYKLGFHAYFLLFNGQVDVGKQIYNVIEKNIFKYTTHFFLDNVYAYLAVFLAPESLMFFNQLIALKKYISKKDVAANNKIRVFKRLFYQYNYNFQYYDLKRREWNIEWFSWYITARKFLERNEFVRYDFRPLYKTTDVLQILQNLSTIDFQILNYLLRHKTLTRRKLRETLRKRINLLNDRIAYLK